MSRIFLSHSSANNAAAVALRDWLMVEGWDDVFLDLDPKRGIGAGEHWERALNEAAYRCEAVVFLVSKAWLASAWCIKEFHLAAKLSKRMFGVLIEDMAIAQLPGELTATWQLVNLAKGADHDIFRAVLPDGREEHVTFSRSGLQRLKTGLAKAGLDPRFFAWPPENDPERPLYRGLLAMEAGDAGIFFGREAPIIEALDRLRRLRDAAEPRVLVILGASGAGKSSFLRAGLIPRLARDDRNFLVLPVIRPERDVLSGETGLQRSLELACKAQELGKTRAEINKTVENGSSDVISLLEAIVRKGTPPKLDHESEVSEPSIILAIDQGEELFQAEGGKEAQSFFALLRDLVLARAPNLIILFTIRSDSYEILQTTPALIGIRQETLSLPPMPKGAYQMVIEGPAARLRDTKRALRIEHRLTQALLSDIETGGAKDALPLLAFTLERLYLEHGGDGDLKYSEYEEIGGIAGSIEAAVKRTLRVAGSDPALPDDEAERLALIRRAFIPWLASIDPDTGSPRRAIARLADIPEKSRPLVRYFVKQRLLVEDSNQQGETTVEPAHEAVLRQWGLLRGWLAEDSAHLSALGEIERAARDWLANDRSPARLAHVAGRLEDAEQLKDRSDLAAKIKTAEWEYLSACRAVENLRRDRELNEAHKLASARKIGLVVACVLTVLAVGLAAFGWNKATEAELQSEVARQEKDKALYNESVALSSLSTVALSENLHAPAVKLALAAWPRYGDESRPALRRTVDTLAAALPHYRQRLVLRGHEESVLVGRFSPDSSNAITAARDDTVRLWDTKNGKELGWLEGNGKPASSIFLVDGDVYVGTQSAEPVTQIWNATKGVPISTLNGHEAEVFSTRSSSDGTRVVTASADRTARVWNTMTGEEIVRLTGHDDSVGSASFSPDGSRVVTISYRTARVWEIANAERPLITIESNNYINDAAISSDNTRLVTVSVDGTANLWDPNDGRLLFVLGGHEKSVTSADFSPDNSRVVTASEDGTARLWDVKLGKLVALLKGHDGALRSVTFSPDGARILTTSEDRTARVWDVKTWQVMAFIGDTGAILSAVMSGDGKRVTTASRDSAVSLWDARTGKETSRFKIGDDSVNTADISLDGTRVVATYNGEPARLWNSETGEPIEVLKSEDDLAESAAFSPDGAYVVTMQEFGWRLWDAKSGSPVVPLESDQAKVSSVVFSLDGTRLVVTSHDSTARLWDIKERKQVAVLEDHQNPVLSAAFSPDGRWVVTVSDEAAAGVSGAGNAAVRVWDAGSGRQIAELSGKDKKLIISAAFSPDGARLVTASKDGTGAIWEAASGRWIADLRGHQDEVTSAVFLPDGHRVVTASQDATVRIWDAETGVEIAALGGHESWITSMKVLSNGRRVLTTSEDGTTRLWDITSLERGDAFAVACQRLGQETNLQDAPARYRPGATAPICGEAAPLPVDFTKLQ